MLVFIYLQDVEEWFEENTFEESTVAHDKLDPEHGCGKKDTEKDVITFQNAVFKFNSIFVVALNEPHDSEENEAGDYKS